MSLAKEAVKAVRCRVMTWNPGPRSSSATAKIKWILRRARAVKLLLQIEGGPPSVILLQECTREMQIYFVQQLRKAGYEYGHYGNGMGGHPEDRSGDNVVVLYLLEDWDRITARQGWAYSPDRDYFVAVQLQRKGTNKKRWFVSSHPTSGSSARKNRINQVRGQIKVMRDDCDLTRADFDRMIWGMDSNDTAKSTVPGVRQELRNINLRTNEEQLPNTPIGDTAHGFGRDKYVPHTGYVPLDLIASNPLQAKARYFKVITDDPKAGDHYPVLVGMELL